jgi:hypothetical protein
MDDVVAIAGDLATVPTLDTTTLKTQDALVRALHERCAALLPMRFGTRAATEHEAREKIRGVEGLRSRLDRAHGCEQMTVRVLGDAGAPAGATPLARTGTEYLLQRARARHGHPLLQVIAAAAGDLVRDTRVDIGSHPGVIGSVYHLIERGHASEYRIAVARTTDTLADVRVIVTGPSPAYAFA